ncbi:hypothetical protein EXS54_02495 [Patescibacteria group bacterium]|nr:hypothetical protein [Patescibacteria group bacterium]
MPAENLTPEFYDMDTMELVPSSDNGRVLEAWEQQLHVQEMANNYHVVDFSDAEISSREDLVEFFDSLPVESIVCFEESPAEGRLWSIKEARVMASAALDGNDGAMDWLPQDNGMKETVEHIQEECTDGSRHNLRRLMTALSSSLYH